MYRGFATKNQFVKYIIFFLFILSILSFQAFDASAQQNLKEIRQPFLKKTTPSADTFTPQQYDKTPKVSETFQDKIERENAGKITEALFNSIIHKVFENAALKANACGGSWVDRKSVINLPNLYYKEDALERLHYDLTRGEREKTSEYRANQRKSIRACVDSWNSKSWFGSVRDGNLILFVEFGDCQITTRAITPHGKWRDEGSRKSIPDKLLMPILIVKFSPAYNNGVITFKDANVAWTHKKWMYSDYGHFRLLPKEPDMIENYTNKVLEIIRQRYDSAFNSQNVKSAMSQQLTNALLSNKHVSRITGLIGKGNNGNVLLVSYE